MSQNELSTQAAHQYLRGEGVKCPFCNDGDSLEGSSINIDEGYARQEMVCNNCEEEWTDSYRLDAIFHESGVFEREETPEEAAPATDKLDCLHELFSRLRAADFDKVSDVMREIASFIAMEEKKLADV